MDERTTARATRIVYVVENAGFHGDERLVLQLVAGLPRGRYQAAVACRPGGPLVDGLYDLGVPVIDLEARRPADAVRELAASFRRRRPQLVHALGNGGSAARVAARLARVAAVVAGPGPAAPTGPAGSGRRAGRRGRRRGVLDRLAEWATRRLVDRWVVSDRASVEALVGRRGIARGRVAVIPGGVDLDRYDRARVRRGGWRARLGVPAGAVLMGGAGRLVPEKGFADLVRAFAAVERPELWLVIAGDGPEWEELQTLARAFGVWDRVALPGFVDDLPALLADLDLFVLPSRVEDHPQALLEAMAMALPVVAADVAGVGDVITDGVDGRRIPPGDLAALAAAIAELSGDAALARRLGRNARRKVEREHTVERMVRRTALLYDGLLAEKGVTRPPG